MKKPVFKRTLTSFLTLCSVLNPLNSLSIASNPFGDDLDALIKPIPRKPGASIRSTPRILGKRAPMPGILEDKTDLTNFGLGQICPTDYSKKEERVQRSQSLSAVPKNCFEALDPPISEEKMVDPGVVEPVSIIQQKKTTSSFQKRRSLASEIPTPPEKELPQDVRSPIESGDAAYKTGKKDEAESFYMKATESKHPFAQYRYGQFYYRLKRYAEAELWLTLSARQGYADAQYRLGRMHDLDQVENPDNDKALKHYESAADQGHAKANFELGRLMESDDKYELAKGYYYNAALQKHAEAQFRLYVLYHNGCVKNWTLEKEMRWLTTAAKNGNADAQVELGNWWRTNTKDYDADYANAFTCFNLAADQNHPKGLFGLGKLYEFGQGVEKDLTQAKTYYERAYKTRRGCPEAQYRVGRLYFLGEGGIEMNKRTACYLFEEASKNGYEPADTVLWSLYAEEKHYDKARVYAEKLAKKDHVEAENWLGVFYQEKGQYPKAIEWFGKAANHEHPGAQNDLGKIYAEGTCDTPPDLKKAEHYFTLAADQKQRVAQHNLGLLKEQLGDILQAIKYYVAAAQQEYAASQAVLGCIYRDGCPDIAQDYSQSIHYFTLAAQQGHAEAQYHLGWFLSQGPEEFRNLAQAKESYLKAARNRLADDRFIAESLPDLQFNVGCIFEQDEGSDPNQEIKWYTKAAMNGHVDAQCRLGQFYGTGANLNFEKATHWFTLAAGQKHPIAQYNLGLLEELSKNISQAMKWYKEAADQGHQLAQTKIKELQEKEKATQKMGQEEKRSLQSRKVFTLQPKPTPDNPQPAKRKPQGTLSQRSSSSLEGTRDTTPESKLKAGTPPPRQKTVVALRRPDGL